MPTATLTRTNPTETGAPAIPEVVLPDLEPETIQRLGNLLLAVAHDPYIPSVVTRGSHLVEEGLATTEEVADAMQEASRLVAEHSGAELVTGYRRQTRPLEKKAEQEGSFNRFHVDGNVDEPVGVNMNVTHAGGTHVIVGRVQPGVAKLSKSKELLREGKVDTEEIVTDSLAQATLRPGDAVALADNGTHHLTGESLGGTAHLFNVAHEDEVKFRVTEAAGYEASNPINHTNSESMM